MYAAICLLHSISASIGNLSCFTIVLQGTSAIFPSMYNAYNMRCSIQLSHVDKSVAYPIMYIHSTSTAMMDLTLHHYGISILFNLYTGYPVIMDIIVL